MDSVRFACQPGCIACCEQEGFVYLTEDDLKRAAAFVGMSARAFEKQYVHRTAHQIRFRKPRDKQCPFLLENECGIHPAKPEQCRTFPFWPELLLSKKEWTRTARYCPGIGKGSLIQIEAALRPAEAAR